jgi:proline iminopeptidase
MVLDRYNCSMTRQMPSTTVVITLLAFGCVADVPQQATEPTAASGLENGSFSATLNGHQIHYEIHGTGPILMTVPNSWGLTLSGLRALYRPLEERLTMVYFDPRGMGGSGPVVEDTDMSLAAVRDDFDALRLHLELDRVNAIGWSNGATNLAFLASERPESLASAIFVHGVSRATAEDFAGFATDYPEWAAASAALQQYMARDDVTEEQKTERFRRFNLEEAFPYLFADPEAGRRILAEAWAEVGFSVRHGTYSQQELGLFDLSEQIAAISARSLVLAGAHDLLPPERAEEISTGVADGEFLLFENSGHFAQLEEPAAFLAAVVGFLEEG